MKASVIIPTYNMGEELRWSLEFLARQELASDLSFEVLVVDDGSSDTTADCVRTFASRLDMKYIFRARDAESCRARARNLGLFAASGELCVFLDSGVLVEPTFVQAALRRHQGRENAVLMHQILGLFAKTFPFDRSQVIPETLRHTFAPLSSNEDWADIRDPLFASVDDDLARLPAAWGLGWSCALSVPRDHALGVSGFDVTFQGWGAEDVDFSYRLARAGADFEVSRDALCVHIPHAKDPSPTRAAEHAKNQRKLHERDYALETELNLFIGSIGCNLLVSRLERSAALSLLPTYGVELSECLAKEIRGRAAVVGANLMAPALQELGVSTIFVQSQRDFSAAARSALEGVEVVRSFCCATRYPDLAFGSLVVGDALRLYPSAVQLPLLRECVRIAKDVFVLCDLLEQLTDRRARYRACDGWRWCSVEELHALAQSANMQLEPAQQTPQFVLFRLRPVMSSPGATRDPPA